MKPTAPQSVATPGPLTIGRIAVSGVDARTAKRLGPALEAALADPRLNAQSRGRIRLTLPHGTTERDIVAALRKALERG